MRNSNVMATLGMSRDDASKFLPLYVQRKIYPDDPFQTLDKNGVGELYLQ